MGPAATLESMSRFRAVFLGQKPVGEAAWDRLRDLGQPELEVAAVCSNADPLRPWWRSARVYETRGDTVFIDNRSRNTEELARVIDELGINLILSVQHPWILEPEILGRVDYALNLHSAKLPAYRGFNAVNHAILNGDRTFTCTAHHMAEAVDAGDVAFECLFALDPVDTALSLYAKCHHATLALFDEILHRLVEGLPIPRRPLVGEEHFYPRGSIEALRRVERPETDELERKARAFYFPPFEPAFVAVGTRKLYVLPEPALDTAHRRESRALLDRTIEASGGALGFRFEPEPAHPSRR